MTSSNSHQHNQSALLVGATGLVGGYCLSALLADKYYDKVLVIARKQLPISNPKLEQHVVDFDKLKDVANIIYANDVYCCLGTTIKKAGSQASFEKVDFQYVFDVAEIAAKNGAEQFLLVSSLGAHPKSSVFYNRIKGRTEEAVSALNFKAVHIFRPSILLGDRTEFRLGERFGIGMMKALSVAMVGGFRKYRPIHAETVAKAMIAAAQSGRARKNVLESDEIKRIPLTV